MLFIIKKDTPMQIHKKLIKLTIISCLFFTSLFAQAFASPSLLSEMADLDQIIIPAAALSNQAKAEETKIAVLRLQSQWAVFLASAEKAFPGDKGWISELDLVGNRIAEVVKASEEGDFPKVHEILEEVRLTFEDLREKRNIDYYLDRVSRYRKALEKTTGPLAGKKASDLTDADIKFIASMDPVLKSTWASVQAAPLGAELFHFDSSKTAEIKSAMDSVQNKVDNLEAIISGGTRDQVFEALNLLRPSLKKAFLMFGKY